MRRARPAISWNEIGAASAVRITRRLKWRRDTPIRQRGRELVSHAPWRFDQKQRTEQTRQPGVEIVAALEVPSWRGRGREDERKSPGRMPRRESQRHDAAERHAANDGLVHPTRREQIAHLVDVTVQRRRGFQRKSDRVEMRRQRLDGRLHVFAPPLDTGDEDERRLNIASVPQRLSGFQRVLNALERLPLAAQLQEGFALEVEQYCSPTIVCTRQRAARQHHGERAADDRIVIADSSSAPRQMNAELERRSDAFAADGNGRAGGGG